MKETRKFDPITNPKELMPGTVLRHIRGGCVTLDRRKEDGTGWWLREGGGVHDVLALGSGDWTVVAPDTGRTA